MTALVLFGGGGDLAMRMLLPSLYFLEHDGLLPDGLEGHRRGALGEPRRIRREGPRRRRGQGQGPTTPGTTSAGTGWKPASTIWPSTPPRPRA